MGGVPGEVMAVVFPVVGLVILVGVLAVPVAKGRWWVLPIVVAAVASFRVVFTVEPSESFQESATFKFVEAGLNLALYGGFGALVYGLAARPKPGSWWARRHPSRTAQEPSMGTGSE